MSLYSSVPTTQQHSPAGDVTEVFRIPIYASAYDLCSLVFFSTISGPVCLKLTLPHIIRILIFHSFSSFPRISFLKQNSHFFPLSPLTSASTNWDATLSQGMLTIPGLLKISPFFFSISYAYLFLGLMVLSISSFSFICSIMFAFNSITKQQPFFIFFFFFSFFGPCLLEGKSLF